MRALILVTLMLSGCAARQPMVIQNAVTTPPPRAFWICPDAGHCDAAIDPSAIPKGYVCILQVNKITVCSPGGQVSLPPPSKLMTPGQTIEHLLLGAGCYGALYAAAGSGGRPGAAAGAGCLLVAGFKEGSDVVSGRDSRKQAIVHAITILVGAGAVAAFKH